MGREDRQPTRKDEELAEAEEQIHLTVQTAFRVHVKVRSCCKVSQRRRPGFARCPGTTLAVELVHARPSEAALDLILLCPLRGDPCRTRNVRRYTEADAKNIQHRSYVTNTEDKWGSGARSVYCCVAS